MKKIVLSAVTAIVLTFGVYHIARLMGASEHIATTSTFAAAFAFAIAIATVAVATTPTFATTATVVAFIVASAAIATFIIGVIATTEFALVAAIFGIGAFIYFVDSVKKHGVLDPVWVGIVYALETLTIFGALYVKRFGWSMVIALGGVAVLLIIKSKVNDLNQTVPENKGP